MAAEENAEKYDAWTDSNARIVMGMVAAVLLHQAIYAVNCAIIALIEKGPNPPDYVRDVEQIHNTPASIAWLLVFAVGAALLWWRAKPAASIFTLPFALATCFWLFPYWLTPTLLGYLDVYTDGGDTRSVSDFARGMFFACSAVTVIGITRLKLGEGRQQTVILKQIVGIPVPEDLHLPASLQYTLLRASSPPKAPHETLLRPVKGTMETPPEELLRHSREASQD